MLETNKLINNGYLRSGTVSNTVAGTVAGTVANTGSISGSGSGTYHFIKNTNGNSGIIVGGGSGGTMKLDADGTEAPLLSLDDATKSAKARPTITSSSSSLSLSKAAPPTATTTTAATTMTAPPATFENHNKLPTVVYLGDGNATTTTTTMMPTTVSQSQLQTQQPPQQQQQQQPTTVSTASATSQQQQQQQLDSDILLLKPTMIRRRLLIVAVVFVLVGALFGALALHLANISGEDSRRQCQAPTEAGIVPEERAHFIDAEAAYSGHNVCLSEHCVRTAASLLSAMDTTMDPCENFFQYACGTWNKKHIIPEDRSSISTFEVLADEQQVILKGVLEEKLDEFDNQATIKAKTFYKSCMDIPQIRMIGEGRLHGILRTLGGWPVIEKNWKPPHNITLEQVMGQLRAIYGEPVITDLYVGPDDKNSSINILELDQMPFALPSRDYYLKPSSENELKAYHKYMTQTAILLGADPKIADEELDKVVQFEIRLVNATLPEADRHDTSAIYTKMTLPELQKLVPQLNWTDYLQTALSSEIPLQRNESLVSYATPYLIEMGQILMETDRRVIHNYMLWRLVMSITTHMVDEYMRERVEFRKILMGIQTERLRWSQCVEWTNKKLGTAVGALFIRDNFNQESKDTALEMIHTIREAFSELLDENHWMDDETRAVARDKANAMNERIGFPDVLTNATELEKEYENLTIIEDNFMENVLNILRWDSDKNLQLLRTPVDKEKWTTEPAVVNAFYNPNKNDIVFPAGILQPLFYSQNFPKSLNYGGIGVVIGHEITHGFDDKGRQYDKDGNMMQWWNNATIEAFRKRAQCIIDQYSRYKVDEVGLFMNGRMTQGENIADNGGLKQAFRAYRKWVKLHGPEEELPGLNLTHDQLFFLNYAQIWCGSMRPEDALTKIRSSVHSPGSIRVLGPLSNSIDFAMAYHCEQGSPMNPYEKCNVW